MNLKMVLADLFEIRRTAVRAGSFPGYRAAPVAFSGGVALLAGGLQMWMRPDPFSFVLLWSSAAFVGLGYNLFCIVTTYGASPRRWERILAYAALTDLSPSVIGGFLLTVVFALNGNVPLLPGLWMILFGTGIMSSRRHLPKAGTLLGAAYILAGTCTLYWLAGPASLRAEVMAGVFGVGQLLLAAALMRSDA